MKFDYLGQNAHLSWYTQDLITTSLDAPYGREVLCRGFISETQTLIPMGELMPYLYNHCELLLSMTCQQISDVFQKQFMPSNSAVSTWINIAGQLIADDDLFEQLWLNAFSSLTTKQKQTLVLEICEDDISDDTVIERVSFLKKNGFMIAMDDFGSGHSNLLRLNQSQFDIIKLDLKLLNKVPTDLWVTSFYREIVNLCSSKGCLIVAEGVETQAQSDFVRWAGVDLIQGFLYSKPKLLA